MGRLDGKVALISGGARGQGATEAQLFCREGAQVVCDVLDDDGRKVEGEIMHAAGGKATYVHLNVTREADWKAAVDTRRAEIWQAQYPGEQCRDSHPQRDRRDDRRRLGPHYGGQRQGRLPRDEIRHPSHATGWWWLDYQHFLNCRAGRESYGSSAYTATKARCDFTKATAVQHAKDKIRCNSVHPGPIDTEMMRDVLGDAALRDERLRRIPLGRAGTTADIAYGVLYLASDESSFVTGSELVIDGGSTAQ